MNDPPWAVEGPSGRLRGSRSEANKAEGARLRPRQAHGLGRTKSDCSRGRPGGRPAPRRLPQGKVPVKACSWAGTRRLPPGLRLRRRATRTACFVMTAALAVAAAPRPCGAEVELTAVPPSARWVGATEPQALRLACSRVPGELEAFFAREDLPFRPDLVRRAGGRACHVFYRPTVPGFRAAPDDDPLTEILFDTDPLLYLAAGPRSRGEPVGAMREVLRRIRRPLAGRHPVPSRPRRRGLRECDREELRRHSPPDHPPRSRGRAQLLVGPGLPEVRRLGPGADDPRALADLRGEPRDRAGLRAPAGAPLPAGACRALAGCPGKEGTSSSRGIRATPRRLVLYYGRSAKPYWAETLGPREFEYVLSLEFGADRAVDLSGLAPHVDYFVSFLPREKLALVSVPVSGDLRVARAAVEALLARFGGSAAEEPRRAARRLLSSADPDRRRVRQTLERPAGSSPSGSSASIPGSRSGCARWWPRACPDGEDCFSVRRVQLRMLEADPATFEDWIHATQSARYEPAVMSCPPRPGREPARSRCPRTFVAWPSRRRPSWRRSASG